MVCETAAGCRFASWWPFLPGCAWLGRSLARACTESSDANPQKPAKMPAEKEGSDIASKSPFDHCFVAARWTDDRFQYRFPLVKVPGCFAPSDRRMKDARTQGAAIYPTIYIYSIHSIHFYPYIQIKTPIFTIGNMGCQS